MRLRLGEAHRVTGLLAHIISCWTDDLAVFVVLNQRLQRRAFAGGLPGVAVVATGAAALRVVAALTGRVVLYLRAASRGAGDLLQGGRDASLAGELVELPDAADVDQLLEL